MDGMAQQELPEPLRKRIAELIAKDDVVLFMKGTPGAPRCGFSASVVSILDELQAKYSSVDVLADPEVREGIKAYSQWPTIPQLFVKGELLGGADIAKEMYASGELQKKLGAQGTPAPAPTASSVRVTLTAAAAAALREAKKGAPAEHAHLRIAVSKQFKHTIGFGPELPGDVATESEGVSIRVEGASARRADELRIDVVGNGFKIENPNEPKAVRVIRPNELKAKLDEANRSGKKLELFDVRSPGEAAIAHIDGARLLDDGGRAYLEGLPKDTPLYFFCHHGGRSQGAAEHYLSKGYTDVANLAGGIDAWSLEIDPNVPRY
jgi:monothiol glutaredoxin